MKNSILSAFFLLLSFLSFGQGLTIVATAENGKKDTVTFGYKSNASLGIDTALGEKNILGQPLSDVDVRVVQRDSLNFSCTYTFTRGYTRSASLRSESRFWRTDRSRCVAFAARDVLFIAF